MPCIRMVSSKVPNLQHLLNVLRHVRPYLASHGIPLLTLVFEHIGSAQCFDHWALGDALHVHCGPGLPAAPSRQHNGQVSTQPTHGALLGQHGNSKLKSAFRSIVIPTRSPYPCAAALPQLDRVRSCQCPRCSGPRSRLSVALA